MTTLSLAQEINTLCSLEDYANTLKRIIKSISEVKRVEEYSLAGDDQDVVKYPYNGGHYTLGHLPSTVKEHLMGYVNNDNLRYFLQANAMSYSRFEMHLSCLENLVNDHISYEHRSNNGVALNLMETILKDFG